MEHLEQEFNKRFKDQELSQDGFDANGLWDDISDDLDQNVAAGSASHYWTTAKLVIYSIVLILITAVSSHLYLNKSNDLQDKTLIVKGDIQQLEAIEKREVLVSKEFTPSALLEVTNISNNPNFLHDKTINEKVVKNTIERHIENRDMANRDEPIDIRGRGDNRKLHLNIYDYASHISHIRSGPKAILERSELSKSNQKNNDLDYHDQSGASSEIPIIYELNRYDQTIYFLPQISNTFLKWERDMLEFNGKVRVSSRKQNSKSSFNLTLFSGVNTFTQSYVHSNSDELQNKLNSVAKGYIGFSHGIRLSSVIKEKFVLTSGLEYNSLWNKFSVDEVNTFSRIKTDALLRLWIDQSSGDTLQVERGDVEVAVNQKRKVRHFNQFTRWSIPLEIGLQHNRGKWNYALNAGAIFSFTTSQKGKALNDVGEIIVFDSESNFAPFRSFDIGLRVRPHVEYSLNKRLRLDFTPSWMWMKGYSNDPLISSSIQQWQLTFGVSYAM